MTDYVAKITTKGQMTLPIEVRKALGLRPGDHVRLEPSGEAGFLLTPARRAGELFGSVPHRGRPITIDEIRKASRATFEE
jgi:antitoxin PrlF